MGTHLNRNAKQSNIDDEELEIPHRQYCLLDRKSGKNTVAKLRFALDER